MSVCALVLMTFLAGCGSSNSSTPLVAVYKGPTTSFWAANLITGYYYQIKATKEGTGAHCYVYVEQGQSVSPAAIDAIINEFDTKIYPGNTANFGSEPNPGIDNDAKVYIVLLDIIDGFNDSGSYVAGYFDPTNEYATSASNQKEVFFMDTYPATPGSADFHKTLAHEFQHMIHWNQEQLHKGLLDDDTWLNEAMSEIAPVYLYGPSASRLRTFELAPTNSLTAWDQTLSDYGVAYMWAQYFKDRFLAAKPDIFKSMLRNSEVGIASVNTALGEIDSSMTFTTTFNDWGIALYSGSSKTWDLRPEWSYATISAATGSLFTATANTAIATFPTPSVGGFAFYTFAPLSGSTGTATWTAATSSAQKAVLIDTLPTITTDLVSGQAYTFTTAGYLIVSNPVGLYSAGTDTVVHTSLFQSVAAIEETTQLAKQQTAQIKTPKTMLDEADNDPHVKQMVQETGEPVPLCIHAFMKEKEKALKVKGAKPGFVIRE